MLFGSDNYWANKIDVLSTSTFFNQLVYLTKIVKIYSLPNYTFRFWLSFSKWNIRKYRKNYLCKQDLYLTGYLSIADYTGQLSIKLHIFQNIQLFIWPLCLALFRFMIRPKL